MSGGYLGFDNYSRVTLINRMAEHMITWTIQNMHKNDYKMESVIFFKKEAKFSKLKRE